MPRPPVDDAIVHWWKLEHAFGHIVAGHHSYLDRKTGEPITIEEESPDSRALQIHVQSDSQRYIRIEPVPSREQHHWLVRFIDTVTDAELRDRLSLGVSQPGAFRVFKDILQACAAERDRWFAFRKQQLHGHIERWFLDRGLQPSALAGEDTRSAANLRKVGHALIDRLPTNSLPSALAFLMHLCAWREMGSASR